MSNASGSFIPPAAAAHLFNPDEKLETTDDELDEGETTDSQATVDEDIREADDANEKIDE